MPSPFTNQAAWLDAPGTPFVLREASLPTPGPLEVVIRLHSVAMNPTDAYRQAVGMGISNFPHVIGCDGAGVVETVGSSISHLKPGDRVIAMSDEFFTHKASHGMFQKFVCTEARGVCEIPEQLSFDDGCVLPVGICTASGMLFEKESLDLDWPIVNTGDSTSPAHDQEAVIVWGASASVGCCAVQLLKAAGYQVVAVASKHNFALVQECGADIAFDHNEADCVDEICKWVEEKNLKLAGVAAVVSGSEVYQNCARIAQRLPGNKFVSTTLPRGMAPEPDLGEGIKTSNCLCISQPDLFTFIWAEWMPQALQTGRLKCLPHPNVVGCGLESIDHACSVMGKGVSGTKLVVSGI